MRYFLLAVLTAAIVGGIYTFSLPGYWLFDDAPNLHGLDNVHDLSSLLDFAISGHSGPLGRPLSLLTFALQAWAWPDDPGAMLQINILIHVVSILGAYTLALGLFRVRPAMLQGNRAAGMALICAFLWGASPFLATTQLMIIQRMTGLAGLFTFWGLAGVVWANVVAPNRPRLASFMLVLGLGLGMLLATLSKENGALLPLLALVIQYLWVPREQRLSSRLDRFLMVSLAVLPSLLLLGYLIKESISIGLHGYGAGRYFTPYQRLISEPAILLDYLSNLLRPRPANVTPFMDGIPAATGWFSPPVTGLAMIFWMALLVIAVRLRQCAPYLLFGIVFFLVGHLLESSIIGLELYFAHRNYVPAFGVFFAIAAALGAAPEQYRRVCDIGVVAYSLLTLAVLVQVMIGWQQQDVNAEMWVTQNPNSQRAAQFLAMRYQAKGDPVAALKMLDRVAAQDPQLATVQIELTVNCAGREAQYSRKLAETTDLLKTIRLEPGVGRLLADMAERDDLVKYCPSLRHTALQSMAEALLTNPNYAADPVIKAQLLITKAHARAAMNDIPGAISQFQEAFRASPNLEPAFLATSLMANAGDYERAYKYLGEVELMAPSRFVSRKIWLEQVKGFRQVIKQSQKIDQAKAAPKQQ